MNPGSLKSPEMKVMRIASGTLGKLTKEVAKGSSVVPAQEKRKALAAFVMLAILILIFVFFFWLASLPGSPKHFMHN